MSEVQTTPDSKKGNGGFIAAILLLLLAVGFFAYLWSAKNSALNECENNTKALTADMDGMNQMMSGYVDNMSNDLRKDFQNMLETYDALIDKEIENVKEGRALVSQLLDSLKWYQDVACLSLQNTATDQVTDILERIEQPITHERIVQFFMDDFYYDFLWIEATDELLQKPWLVTIRGQLNQYNIDHMIPIIVISY